MELGINAKFMGDYPRRKKKKKKRKKEYVRKGKIQFLECQLSKEYIYLSEAKTPPSYATVRSFDQPRKMYAYYMYTHTRTQNTHVHSHLGRLFIYIVYICINI